MNNIIKEMQEPCLLECGFYRDNKVKGYNSEGLCYSIMPDIGKGHYWLYANNNLFSISILDFVFYENFIFEYQQPRYLSINCYDSVSGEELNPYKRLKCNCIRTHVSDNDLYQAIFHKNIPIHSIGIEVMPEYYEDYLNTKYPGEFKDTRSAFMSIDGSTDFPELIFLLRQIHNFRGTGTSAKMYYEGKVTEAISLIIEKTKAQKTSLNNKQPSREDIIHLESVKSYIDNHFASDILLDQLAQIAYMGTTKLKYTFKNFYRCTITEYIQNKRMSYAEHLLTNTDLNINQIGQFVGYHLAGHFSKLFKKNTGLLPTKYRKLSMMNLKL